MLGVEMILVWLHTNLMWARHLNCFRNRKRFPRMCKNVTAFMCLSACSVRVSSPMLYRSNNQLNEAETEWMTRVWGNTSDASAAPSPPTHPPPVSPTHPPASSRHKTNTYDSQQEQLYKSGCSSIEFALLFLFVGLCSVSVLLVALPSKHDCFVMQSKLRP